VKNGKSDEGKQRYRCRNADCSRRSFMRDYSYRGYLPEVKQQISDMAVNGSGIRDTARVLKISPTTVIEELKKRSPSRTSQHSSIATDEQVTDERDGGKS
jgi:transposase-like protein